MRKQLLAVFLPLLVILMAAAETQSTGTQASAPHAALQKVRVVRSNDGVSVEMKLNDSV